MFSIFPILEPTVAGIKIMIGAITSELSGLITKDVAKSVWNIIKFIVFLVLIIIFSFLKSITIDFFSNIAKYLRKDF